MLVKSNTLRGRTLYGTVVTAVEGPNSTRIDEARSGGLPSGSEPMLGIWTGSVNSIVIVVAGSTPDSPLPGMMTGIWSEPASLTSGGTVSMPTVAEATAW